MWETNNTEIELGVAGRKERIQELYTHLSDVITRSRPSAMALVAALIYTVRLAYMAGDPSRDKGCSTAILMTALMMGVKYFDAYALGTLPLQTHRKWASFIDASFDDWELLKMECDFVRIIGHDLDVRTEEIEEFFEAGHLNEGRCLDGLVPRSVDHVASLGEVATCHTDCLVPEQAEFSGLNDYESCMY